MNSKKSREIKKIALHTWSKILGVPFKNFYRRLKKEYVKGNYHNR